MQQHFLLAFKIFLQLNRFLLIQRHDYVNPYTKHVVFKNKATVHVSTGLRFRVFKRWTAG